MVKRARALPAAIALAALLVSSSCSFPLSRDPDLLLTGLVWMDDGWLYALSEHPDTRTALVRTREDTDPEPVDFAPRDCALPDADALARVTAGVLAVAATCTNERGTFVFAMDLTDDLIRQIGYTSELGTFDGGVAWSSDFSVGYLAAGLCQTVAKIENGFPARFSEPIEVDGVRWRLDRNAAAGCREGGAASDPFVSNQFLYLAVSGQAKAADDGAWSDAPRTLVRMSLPEGPISVIVDGLTKLRDFAVSPDGTKLVVSASRNGTRTCWLIDTRTGETVNLQVDVPQLLSISPDGRRVAILVDDSIQLHDLPG